jgi:peptidoglycan/xylan/chitin deacetylase (PgdA/CDA1 family)
MRRRQFVMAGSWLALACRAPGAGEREAAAPREGALGPSGPIATAPQRRLAITMDDPNTYDTPLYGVEGRNRLILEQLAARRVQVMLFVCGKRIDSPEGAALLSAFNAAGHLLANHSYEHRFYNEPTNTADLLARDIAQCESLIAPYRGFRRRFRFPYLKEGETLEKRDAMRAVLRVQGYANGHVTIDASDWAYDERLVARLKADPAVDLAPFRAAYLTHMLDRARYYDELATQLTGASIPHTLLVHHNLLNALFLGDLLDALEHEGFHIIAPETAYADPVFAREPSAIPAGESLLWSLAHGDERLRAQLRYPAEDARYEAAILGQL